mmetsp:Transcript_71414/g.149120  ORF Transcript_71414/g.149120 Transcript_71414/m.149120 type:complete len:219 (-) Transcript_71414:572-1228(-)
MRGIQLHEPPAETRPTIRASSALKGECITPELCGDKIAFEGLVSILQEGKTEPCHAWDVSKHEREAIISLRQRRVEDRIASNLLQHSLWNGRDTSIVRDLVPCADCRQQVLPIHFKEVENLPNPPVDVPRLSRMPIIQATRFRTFGGGRNCIVHVVIFTIRFSCGWWSWRLSVIKCHPRPTRNSLHGCDPRFTQNCLNANWILPKDVTASLHCVVQTI